jgi:hypothetical protein
MNQIEVIFYFLFFNLYFIHDYNKKWYKLLKIYCKRKNFLSKYKVRDNLSIPNFYSCVKNKNGKNIKLLIIYLHKD